MKSPGVNPHINGQMIFDNTAKAIHGEDTFFNKWLKSGYPQAKE